MSSGYCELHMTNKGSRHTRCDLATHCLLLTYTQSRISPLPLDIIWTDCIACGYMEPIVSGHLIGAKMTGKPGVVISCMVACDWLIIKAGEVISERLFINKFLRCIKRKI